jgi:valyl-tRNA synthetase
MKLEKNYNPKKTEERIYRLWQKSGFFNPDRLPKDYKKTYTIFLPPPNITGQLHMGHALNAVIQDLLIRWKRLKGFRTLWLPGIDHAGIATQNVVEKELKKEGKTRFDLGREKFIERVWQWKNKYGNIILEQLKKIGCSLDWSRTRFTMDRDYTKAVMTAFKHYYEKGWIYLAKRVVNWCPRCQTSLSDLELEYREEKSKLWYIKYPLKDSKDYILVATTRPETMLGDVALAVNPTDKRYKTLVGKKAILPLVRREIPIIADKLINPDFGTGVVKVTPAHDLRDYEIGKRHNLEIIQVIDEKGKITREAPSIYQNLSVIEARQKVIEDLKSLNLLEKSEDYTHQLPKCYRCNTTIELIMSEQWFLKMEELAKIAIEAVKSGKVKFVPKRWEKIYFDWLKNIKDWCLSRQIWWGHQIPVWRCQKKESYFVSLEKPKKCPTCEECQAKQIEDVLDTWFSSALWPFATLGWPKETKDLKIFYPSEVIVTDRGIINLWVARMIFSGLEFRKKIPFKEVYINPTVLTKEGKRMSKSLGIGVDPLELIEKYGADATRFGIIFQVMGGQDMKFGEENIVMGRKFCNKVWNASRFVLEKIKNSNYSLSSLKKIKKAKTKADRKILKLLKETEKEIDKDLTNFRFGQAAHKIYNFFWHDFCDFYIEESKKQKNSETKKILLFVLLNSLKILHPFIPFLTEEIYQKLPIKNKKKFLMIERK